jgi:hypothetical protein
LISSTNDLTGQEVTLDALRSDGKPVLLAFTDAGCAACGAILPDLARWQRQTERFCPKSCGDNRRNVGSDGRGLLA